MDCSEYKEMVCLCQNEAEVEIKLVGPPTGTRVHLIAVYQLRFKMGF